MGFFVEGSGGILECHYAQLGTAIQVTAVDYNGINNNLDRITFWALLGGFHLDAARLKCPEKGTIIFGPWKCKGLLSHFLEFRG